MAAVVCRTSTRLFRTVAMSSPCRKRDVSSARDPRRLKADPNYIYLPSLGRYEASEQRRNQAPVPRLIVKATATAWPPPSAIDSAAGLCSDGPLSLRIPTSNQG